MIPRRWLLDEWREAFLVQAQLHELPGSAIGEALAEIDAHCADSGQSPDEAFGDPVSYTAALASGLRPGSGSRAAGRGSRLWVVALTSLGVLGGIYSLLEGVRAVAQGDRGALTGGNVLGMAAGAVAITVIAAVVLRPGSRRRLAWGLPAALAAGFGAMMIPPLLWDDPVVQAPGWVLLAVGALLLTVAWWPLVSGRLHANRVVDPRTGEDSVPTSRWVERCVRWGMPLLVVVVGLVLVLVLGGTATT